MMRLLEMPTNNNKHKITMNTTIIFPYITFLSTVEVLVVFNISSSHASTNLNIHQFYMFFHTHNYMC